MSPRNQRSMPSDCHSATRWLILHAAHRAPESLSSRLEEEWLADLESRSSALSRLRFALGCCWAIVVIAREHPRSAVPAAASAAAAKGLVTFADRNLGYFSARSGTIFLVAGLHAALFYGLITTLSHTRVPVTPADLENQVAKPVPPAKLPPPLPPAIKMLSVPRLLVEPPQNLDIETDEVTTRVADESLDPAPASPPNRGLMSFGKSPAVPAPDFRPRLTSIRPSRFAWKKRERRSCGYASIPRAN